VRSGLPGNGLTRIDTVADATTALPTLKRPSQRPDRLRLIRIGLEQPETMSIGARARTRPTRRTRSDFPPETRKRSRAAATLFECSGSTHSPAFRSRSTNSPSGRQVATSATSIPTSIRHSTLRPFSRARTSCSRVHRLPRRPTANDCSCSHAAAPLAIAKATSRSHRSPISRYFFATKAGMRPRRTDRRLI
jgi:hypothetical protein